jgi:hypothetical protein
MLSLPLPDLKFFKVCRLGPCFPFSVFPWFALLFFLMFRLFAFSFFSFLWSLGGSVLEVGAGCAGLEHAYSSAPTSSYLINFFCVAPLFLFSLFLLFMFLPVSSATYYFYFPKPFSGALRS